MKLARSRQVLSIASALSFAPFANAPVHAQSTAFTYRGKLDDAGGPASGLHDFRFLLFNAAAPGGVVIGPPICADDVDVVDGVFTVELDFGVQTDGLMGVGTTSPTAKLDVRGDVKLGASGEYDAVKSPASDRSIRGTVLFNGTIDATRSSPASRSITSVPESTASTSRCHSLRPRRSLPQVRRTAAAHASTGR
jgi:hypothetical protein